jgi:hypothetical protein
MELIITCILEETKPSGTAPMFWVWFFKAIKESARIVSSLVGDKKKYKCEIQKGTCILIKSSYSLRIIVLSVSFLNMNI